MARSLAGVTAPQAIRAPTLRTLGNRTHRLELSPNWFPASGTAAHSQRMILWFVGVPVSREMQTAKAHTGGSRRRRFEFDRGAALPSHRGDLPSGFEVVA